MVHIFLPKLSWPTLRKIVLVIDKKICDLRLNAEILRSVELFARTVRGQNNSWYQNAFLTSHACFLFKSQYFFPIWIQIFGIYKHARKVRKSFFHIIPRPLTTNSSLCKLNPKVKNTWFFEDSFFSKRALTLFKKSTKKHLFEVGSI